jgi:Glutamate-cysteine ligase family 2(GCS2)
LTNPNHRCLGLEQEFFLVDEGDVLSNSADGLLAGCWETARSAGKDPACFAPEVSSGMIEVIVPPARSLAELSGEYLEYLELALEAGRGTGLRLYPLATYPLPISPALRDEPRYRMQARTLGQERYSQAGRCTGVHLHLGVHPGVVDPRVGVSYDVPKEARKELLGLYNLATALDPAIVTLGRSSPFYEGLFEGGTPRPLHYRGHPDLAPDSLLANLWEVGGCSLTQPTSRNWSSSGSPPTTPGSRPWTAQGWSVGAFSRRVVFSRPPGTPCASTPRERSNCAR